ncbi:cubilin-like [Haliotis rufescens]|uniref:cubilin-like n=1 Tax=Haliotis rufescens TaxID=6454 RepID=UPI00201F8277|nr:cubilin-like [Haliotis rufescens]XP_048245175.1 cubilin-like [Haliotis rufescens]
MYPGGVGGLLLLLCVASFSAGTAAQVSTDVAASCDRNFTAPVGNYSLNTTGPRKCTWQISRNNTGQTSIVFSQFLLGTTDYLVVYDGDGNHSQVINATGKKDSFLVVAFSKKIRIEYSQASNVTVGLAFRYDTKDCLLAAELQYAGRVFAPFYLPGQGPLTCQYHILGLPQTQDKVLALSFTDFNIVSGVLNITDGNSFNSTKGSATAGLPDDFIAADKEVNITFTLANSSITQTFVAVYTMVDQYCSTILNVDNNSTISVNVPGDRSPLTDCRWILRAQPGYTLLLNLTTLRLLPGADKVIITDGGSMASPLVSEMQSLPTEGDLVTSSGSELWVRLVVGDVPGDRTLTVHVYEQANGGFFSGSGNITLQPTLDNSTTAALYYQFSAPLGQQVQITMSTNSLLYPLASLDFYSGLQPKAQPLVSFITDTQAFPVTSPSNTLLMVARNFNQRENFSLEYQAVDQSCNVVASGTRGDYSLTQQADPGTLCRWTVRPASQQGTVSLRITKLSLSGNETVTIYSGIMEYGTTLATFDLTNMAQQLPKFSAPASKGIELVYKSTNTCKNCTSPVVMATYAVSQGVCGGLLTEAAGQLTSPGYPGLYPLNSDCVWDVTNTTTNTTSSQLFYLSFKSFQLGQGHFVRVKDTFNGTSQVLAKYGGMMTPNDILVAEESTSVEFTATSPKTGPFNPEQGFAAKYWKLDCGGNFTTNAPTGKFATPGYPKPVTKSSLCVWIVELPAHGDNSTDRNSVQFKLTVTRADKKQLALLTIHDGGSIRDPLLPVVFKKTQTGNVIARTNTILVMYNYTATTAQDGTGMGFSLTFSAFSCNKSRQCGGAGVCIHPDWVCNGVDDCGDMTDEKNCNGTSPADRAGLVNSYWVPICIILGLVFGAILAFLIPAIYRRIKYPNYSQLRDLSAPVVT